VLDVFGVRPDVDLSLMRPDQTLAGLTARAIDALDGYLKNNRPDLVIVQGDTTTVLAAALVSFYHRLPIGQVEAGLRTWNRYSPYPEEINRVLTSRLTDLHFAPTETAKQNLLREGTKADRIFVTGNTVIDALFLALEKIKAHPPGVEGLPEALQPANATADAPRIILITGHRRENFGRGFEEICHAISTLAGRFPEVHFVYPVHLNPNVLEPVRRILGGSDTQTLPNVHLIKPLSYLPFVAMMNRSYMILTDSGGVQEEGPSLGKPVLVMRDTTERPEAVEAGAAKLVGTDQAAIIANISSLLSDEQAYHAMSKAVNPYGDGAACGRILDACERFLNRR
jgi:UDP-N-acetylglucosamine 2-epimerase (non-hydrolysing)